MLQLSWGKLRKEPATRWFDWSFAPMPNSDNRFARQNCFGPPSGFPLTSTWSGIVHHLSGHIHYAHGIFSTYIAACVDENTPGWRNTFKKDTRNPITVKFFTQIGFIYPFTRAIDRLLGPCFKTGPKGIPNLTVVDRAHNHSHVWVMRTSILWPLKSIRQL